MYLAVESSGMALLRDSIVPVSTISCKKDPGVMRLVKPRRIMPALPTGCATSFPSTAIRFESVLHLFLLYAPGLGWSSRAPRESAATQPSSWASPMSSPSGPRM
jgi:hypothetical protein